MNDVAANWAREQVCRSDWEYKKQRLTFIGRGREYATRWFGLRRVYGPMRYYWRQGSLIISTNLDEADEQITHPDARIEFEAAR